MGGMKEASFTVNPPGPNPILKESGITVPFDSAAETAGPGAAGEVSGCKLVSLIGRVLATCGVTGSVAVAPT